MVPSFSGVRYILEEPGIGNYMSNIDKYRNESHSQENPLSLIVQA